MEVKIVELTTHQTAGKSELNKPTGKQSLLEHLPSTQVICDLKGYLRPNVSIGLCPGKGDSDYTGKTTNSACEYGSETFIFLDSEKRWQC